MHHPAAVMSLKAVAVSLSFLWRCTTALPAGPGFWLNGTITLTSPSDVHTSAAYDLIDTYDASNWLNKFDVQAVSECTYNQYEILIH
jgi:hypothetical protein